MKSIRANPSNGAPEGDERIRTAVPAPGADPVYEARRDRLRIFLNSQGASVQWWDFWPRYVVTLWWRPLRLRVYFWRGRRRGTS